VDEGKFALDFINTGEQGAHFYVYAKNRQDGPWRYTVEAHKSLRETFDLSVTKGAYAFIVHGPNGFVREFDGALGAQDARREHDAVDIEVKTGYDVANGHLYLRFVNHGREHARLSVIDNAYGASARHIELPPRGEHEACWSLAESHHWYDLTVKTGETGAFLRRIAGHIETGRASFTDPAAVAPVTAFA
jgi:phospholipase C